MGDLKRADTVYWHKLYGTTPAYPYIEKSGFSSNQERLVTEALQRSVALRPGQIRELKPPLPQVILNPPRFGYNHDALTAMQILSSARPDPMENCGFSGSHGTYDGTSTPANLWS